MNNFVLIGLCSGADNAHRSALVDSRVIGAIFIDGYGYPTLKYYLKRLNSVILGQSNLFKSINIRIRNLINSIFSDKSEDDKRKAVYFWNMPKKKNAIADLNVLIKRGVNLLFIYTKGAYRYYNHHSQYRNMLKSVKYDDELRVKYYHKSDHMFSLLNDRDNVIEYICQWVTRFQK